MWNDKGHTNNHYLRERSLSFNRSTSLCIEHVCHAWCVLWAKETISSVLFTVVMGNLILTAVNWNEVHWPLLVVNRNSCNGSTACHITKWFDWRVMQHVTQDNVLVVTPNTCWAPSCRVIPNYSWYFFLLMQCCVTSAVETALLWLVTLNLYAYRGLIP